MAVEGGRLVETAADFRAAARDAQTLGGCPLNANPRGQYLSDADLKLCGRLRAIATAPSGFWSVVKGVVVPTGLSCAGGAVYGAEAFPYPPYTFAVALGGCLVFGGLAAVGVQLDPAEFSSAASRGAARARARTGKAGWWT